MRKLFSSRKRLAVLILGAVLLLGAGCGIYAAIGTSRLNRIPDMSFDDMLAYTTKGNERAVITVGVMLGDTADFTVYGEDAAVLPSDEHIYEIGSVTKTFTASLLAKAIAEGRVSLDDPLDRWLELPEGKAYPSLKQLVTHTSGYKSWYFSREMAENYLKRRNDYYGISLETLERQIAVKPYEDKPHPFLYSNFGFAAVGDVLSEIYEKPYTELLTDYIQSDLLLDQTRITDGTGDLGRYWAWDENNAYLPTGGLQSTIRDMFRYLEIQTDPAFSYLEAARQKQAAVDASPAIYKKLGLRTDSAGIAWMLDEEHGWVWHNGGTDNYNCYVAFDPENELGVVILSNLAPGYRIPATIMGPRLMQDLQAKAARQP